MEGSRNRERNRQRGEPRNRPVKIIRNGCVEIRIWLTEHHPPEYRVDVARLYVADDKNGSSRYLTRADLKDAIRGLYDAKQFLSSQSGDTIFSRLLKG